MSFKTIDRGVNGYMKKMYNVQLPEPTVPPLADPCEDASPTDQRQFLEATYGQFATVFQPMLARDPEQFLEELRLRFQSIVNLFVGDGEGSRSSSLMCPRGWARSEPPPGFVRQNGCELESRPQPNADFAIATISSDVAHPFRPRIASY